MRLSNNGFALFAWQRREIKEKIEEAMRLIIQDNYEEANKILYTEMNN